MLDFAVQSVAGRWRRQHVLTQTLPAQVGVIFGNPEITSGGNALKFYASVRLEVRRKETIKGPAGGDDVGIRVKAKVSGLRYLWQLSCSRRTLLFVVQLHG